MSAGRPGPSMPTAGIRCSLGRVLNEPESNLVDLSRFKLAENQLPLPPIKGQKTESLGVFTLIKYYCQSFTLKHYFFMICLHIFKKKKHQKVIFEHILILQLKYVSTIYNFLST